MVSREKVYEALDGERAYQDSCWNSSTTSSAGVHSPNDWLIFMHTYLLDAMHFTSMVGEPAASEYVMNNIRKIGGMCVAAMEQNGAPLRQADSRRVTPNVPRVAD